MTELPSWLTAELPGHDEESTIYYRNGLFYSTEAAGSFAYFNEAYDAVERIGYAPVVDDSCIGHGVRDEGGFGFYLGESDGFSSRMYTSGSRTRSFLESLKDDYNAFLEINKEYQANPGDFVIAYNWLSKHPAFWTRQSAEKTFHWNTDYGMQHAWVSVGRDSTGRAGIMMEHGGHVEPDYTQHYHDTDLDVDGDTFEEVYVAFARKVNEYFDLEGNRLDNPA